MSSREPGNDLGDINSGLPADDVAKEMWRLRNQEKQRRFFEHYHAGATTTGRTSQPETQKFKPMPYQIPTLHDLDHSALELRVSINLANTQRTVGMSPNFVTNYGIQEQTMHTKAAKRIASILRYGSKSRKVDARRALALNLPAASTLQLLRFMDYRNSRNSSRDTHITVEY